MFGSSQGTGLFGAKPAGGGLFGSSTTNTGSTFGSSTTTGGSLFGKPAGTSMFGSAQPASGGGLFGGSSTTAANTSFGTATNTGGGLFGGSSQSNTGGSLFGKPAATTSFGGSGGGGGLFGSSTSTAAAPNGTTIKFTAPVAPDTMMKNGMTQNIQTKNFCISAMKEYEGKSFEELRVDDYIANRKAPAAGSTTNGGLFGASTSTTTTGGGLFGGAQQKPSLFGGSSTTTSSPFGGAATTQGTSLFGGNNNQPQQQQTAGGGLFGKPAGTSLFGGTSTAATGTFGAAQTAPASGGLFGKPATTASPFGGTGTTFGQTAQPAQTGGLFGGGTAGTTSTFGATANTSGGLFGGGTQTNTAAGGLFGKPATATTGSFGFGQTAQPAQAATGGLFGNTAAKGGGLFGATTTPQQGTGLFGATPAQPAGGLFGAQTTQQTGGLFGSTAQQPAGSVVVQNPATVAVATQPIVLGSDVNETMLKMAMIEANLATNPYGDSPLLKLANSLDTDEKPNPVSAQRQMRFLKKSAENNVTTPSSTNGTPLVGKSSFLSMNVPVAGSKIRSRSIAVNGDLNYKSTRTPPTLGKGIGGKGNNTSIVSNTSFNSSFANKSVDPHIERALSNNSNTLPGSAKKVSIKHLDLDEIKSAMRNSSRQAVRSPRDADELPMTEEPEETENSINISVNADPRDAAYRRAEIQRQPPVHLDLNVTSDTNTSNHITSSIVSSPIGGAGGDAAEVFAPAGITLKTSDYFCEPTLRKMAEMVKNGEVYLPEGLTVGRATFGDVYWPGPLTLKDVALDEIVIFRHKEVTVYPDETKKPALGEGLNRPAEVTLERVWYVNRETKEEIKDPIMLAEIGWRDRLERVTLKMGALFKDYRPGTGSWVFKVEHFSKYGLVDDDDDENKAPKPLDEKQRSLQSRVQRTAIHSDQTFTIDNDEVPEEVEMEDIIFVTGSRAVPSALVQGLGGALDASCDMETGYDEHDLVVPPEKKPKIDLDGSSLYEDSKYLLEKLAQSQTFRLPREIHLKCVPATRKFEGGHRSRETKGFGVSRFIDLGSARGQVARVGWSSKGHFVQSLQPEKNSLLINSLSRSGNIQQDYVLDMLEHNIRFSQIIQRNHSISAKVRHHEIDGQHVAPRVKPTNDHAQLIDSFCATANQSSRNDEERVWKLARALLPGSREGRWRWDRLDAVCDWLREEVALLPKLKISGRGAKVWQALCRGQLEEAVAAAQEEGLMFMCTLLATFQVDPRATQQDFQAQIEFWEQFRMLEHLDEHVLKVYLLMAGRPSVKFTSKLGKKVTVGCCDGLPWKQAIGIYLWYLRSFQCFEETLDEATMQIPAPRDADDVLFCHLLKLSRDQAYSVEEVLDAVMDYSSSPFDVHLSWHLWTVLRSLGYNTMNPSAEQRLHVSYAEQLMANSLPHLALFVLSHISSDQARSAIMKESLDRFALTATRADYNRLLDIVSVPASWIASAKYVKAKMSGQNAAACEQAIKAGDYRTAFSTFVEDVAPNAVFSDDLDELERLVTLFEPVTDFIPSWGLQGQIYVDYVDFKRLSKSGDDEDDHRVAELINSLTAKLRAPVFETPIQRLAAQNIGLLMFEAHKMMNDSLEFQMPFDMASLMRELTRSVTATNTGGLF